MIYDLPKKWRFGNVLGHQLKGLRGAAISFSSAKLKHQLWISLSLSLWVVLYTKSAWILVNPSPYIMMHHPVVTLLECLPCHHVLRMSSSGHQGRQHFIGTIFLSQRIGMNTYRYFLVKVKPVKPAPVWNQGELQWIIGCILGLLRKATVPFGSS